MAEVSSSISDKTQQVEVSKAEKFEKKTEKPASTENLNVKTEPKDDKKQEKSSFKEELLGKKAEYKTDWTSNKKVELIEIKIRKINQLFNSFDPSPFLEKDLDDDAFEYIVSSVGEHNLHTKQKIIIYLPKYERRKVSEEEIRRAIHNYFEYKKVLADKSVRLKFQEGQLSLVIGIIFLSCCLILRNFITSTDNLFLNILAEGLIIGGWVAMWKPISNILYDWWPLTKEKKIFHKISKMDIEFVWT